MKRSYESRPIYERFLSVQKQGYTALYKNIRESTGIVSTYDISDHDRWNVCSEYAMMGAARERQQKEKNTCTQTLFLVGTRELSARELISS
jgi:hypothetical protein